MSKNSYRIRVNPSDPSNSSWDIVKIGDENDKPLINNITDQTQAALANSAANLAFEAGRKVGREDYRVSLLKFLGIDQKSTEPDGS